MTEPVRPLEALIAEKIAEWRSEPNRKTHTHRMADELAALLQAAAPPAAELHRFLPTGEGTCATCGQMNYVGSHLSERVSEGKE